jgi:hypothetical protein
MRRRLSAALLVLLCAPIPQASADWFITPFLGTSFGADTTALIFEASGQKLTLGASVALIGPGLLGVELDVGHTPGFFQGDDPEGLVLSSRVTTVGGNVIIAAPLALTRESLRPYVVGGVGLIQARSQNAAGLFPVDQDLAGLTLGAGALGMVSERTGLRFDIRHIKAVAGAKGPFERPGASRVRFWRATAGVTIRY